jgi:hypothetical protein
LNDCYNNPYEPEDCSKINDFDMYYKKIKEDKNFDTVFFYHFTTPPILILFPLKSPNPKIWGINYNTDLPNSDSFLKKFIKKVIEI